MKWIALLLFGGIGLAAFIGGSLWGLQRYTLYRQGIAAQGAVVDTYVSRSTERDGGSTRTSVSYYPVVEFATPDGRKHRFRGSTGSSVSDYEVGAAVEVLYDPANPSVAQIASFDQFWLGPLGVGIFGFAFLVGGIGAFFLIKGSDETFGPEFQRKMDRVALVVGKEGLAVKGVVESVRQQQGKTGDEYVVVCRASLPGGASQERFEAEPIFFNPGPWIVGKPVEIYVDPRRKDRYAVELDPVLAEIAKTP